MTEKANPFFNFKLKTPFPPNPFFDQHKHKQRRGKEKEEKNNKDRCWGNGSVGKVLSTQA